jgi:hypothetical protein
MELLPTYRQLVLFDCSKLYPAKGIDDCCARTLFMNEPRDVSCYSLRRDAVPSLSIHPNALIVP